MMKNIFKLKTRQLKEIALSLQIKVEKGLSENKQEIQCLPTYINPNTSINKGKALVLDLGGTNYRAALVEFENGKPTIHPENGWKKDLSVMKTPGFTKEQLFQEIADLISELNLDEEMPIGYCFSYPAESLTDGDAKLLRWTKGVNIEEMVNQSVGKPLLEYLNSHLAKAKFTDIKVINDTVASLFAGLTEKGYDAYIGLIVGTGTNMATFIPSEAIKKLPEEYSHMGLIPVNLESGNFNPPHLTVVDEKVDSSSDSRGAQRFEKAVSGMYLGEIMKYVFSCDTFEEKFDAQKLTRIMNYSDMYKQKYVSTARRIYKRSAQLVAASLAGLIVTMASHGKTIKDVQLTAEGSLFWSEDKQGKNYKDLVLDELHNLLAQLGYSEIQVHISKKDNANLIGSAIAALS
jgi:hexokinase